MPLGGARRLPQRRDRDQEREPGPYLQSRGAIVGRSVVRTAGGDHRQHHARDDQHHGGDAVFASRCEILQCGVERVLRQHREGSAGRREYHVPAAKPVCRRQGCVVLGGGELSRSLRPVRLLGRAVQSRIAVAAGALRDPEDHPRSDGDRERPGEVAEPRRADAGARLGLGPGIRRGHEPHARARHAGGFRHRHRRNQYARGFRGDGVFLFRARLARPRRAQPHLSAPAGHHAFRAANPAKAERLLGWKAAKKMRDVVASLAEAERARAHASP